MAARAYETGFTSNPETAKILTRAYLLQAGFTTDEIDSLSVDDMRIFIATVGAHMKIQSRTIAAAISKALTG